MRSRFQGSLLLYRVTHTYIHGPKVHGYMVELFFGNDLI